ncbi:MAG: beta-propeller domain-containing protein, partial [Acidimicrobiales bacterium]
MRRLLALLTFIMLIASACSNSAPTASSSGGSPDPDAVIDLGSDDDIAFASALKPFAECSSLLDHLKAEASERVGPWGLNGGGYYFGDDVDLAVEDSGADDSVELNQGVPEAPAAAGDEGFTEISGSVDGDSEGSYSSTNVQELGVDEPDIVKTDGKRIYVVKDNRLIVFDVTGAEPQRLHDITLGDGWGSEMFITDGKVYVMGQGNGEMPLAADVARTSEPGGYYVASTMITEVDLSDAEAEPQLRTLYIEGSSVSARLVGSDLRLVVSTFPNNLPFVAPGNNNQKAQDRATEVNKEVIAESTLEDWLPSYSLVVNGETSSGLLAECNEVNQPATFAGFGSLSVVSLDTNTPLDNGNVTSVLSEGQTVYASTESLYVTTNSWIDPASWNDPEFRPSNDWSTSIHKFSTPVGAPASYQASGKVDGMLLNQFSMSEHKEIFRVATTDGNPWDGDGSESFVTTFEQRGEELVQVGQVGGLGKGEQI